MLVWTWDNPHRIMFWMLGPWFVVPFGMLCSSSQSLSVRSMSLRWAFEDHSRSWFRSSSLCSLSVTMGTDTTPTAMGWALPPLCLLFHGVHDLKEAPPSLSCFCCIFRSERYKLRQVLWGWLNTAGELTAQSSDFKIESTENTCLKPLEEPEWGEELGP